MKANHYIKVCIADDQNYCLDVMQLALEDAPDIDIAGTAHDGEELLQLVKTHQPDVVITDISMQNMDGVTATSLIKKEYGHIKVLGYTQYRDEGLILEMIQAGADGYLYKNTDSQTMVKAVRDVAGDGNFFCTQSLKAVVGLLSQRLLLRASTSQKPIRFMGSEKEVLLLLCEGMNTKQIATALQLSENTVTAYKAQLRSKTKTINDVTLVIYAILHGIYNPDP